jgi:hypothetical protein
MNSLAGSLICSLMYFRMRSLADYHKDEPGLRDAIVMYVEHHPSIEIKNH